MSVPLVSVIIPLYNAAAYIATTIQTVKDQTWANKEIIIVDDGSTDNSLEIAKGFENEWIKILQQPNKGASAARNYGLSVAQGDFIQFLDADDLLSATKIEAQVKALLSHPDHLAVCSTIFFFDGENHLLKTAGTGQLAFLFTTADSFEFLLNLYGANGPKAMTTVHSWLIPKSLIAKAGGWNETISVDDDGEYFCRILLQSKGIVYTPAVYNYYRKFKKGVNLSAQSDKKGIQSMINAIDLKYAMLMEKRPDQIDRINLAMSKHYLSAAASLYPQHKEIVNYCLLQAKKLGYTRIEYEGGKLGKLFSKVFGWKLTKDLSYLSQLIKAKIKYNK